MAVLCGYFTAVLFVADHGRADPGYLDASEIAAISVASLGVAYLGYEIKDFDSAGTSLFTKPMGIDLTFTRILGGNCQRGKCNFLDDKFGSAVTPLVSLTMIVSADLTWPQGDKDKFALQDAFLFSSGLITTKGVTDLAKGLVKRPRPFPYLFPDSAYQRGRAFSAHDYTSFFSGHSSSAFFSMTYLNKRIRSIMRNELSSDEYGDWNWLPPAITFGWATFVGLTRVHAYRHYISDVAAGAVVGWLIAELFYSLNDEQIGDGDTASPMMISLTYTF
jgi:membrane-associated phospholipid phosphatase